MKNLLGYRWSQFAMACCLAAALSASAVAQTPFAYYDFNDPVGSTTLDDGFGTFDATYQGDGTPSYGQGILGGAWRGTGAEDDYFQTAELTALSGVEDLSISIWVNPATTPGFDGLITTRAAETNLGDATNPASGNWGLNQRSNQIDSRVQTGPTSSVGANTAAGSLPIDTWTHVGYSYDGLFGENTVYINGVAAETATGRPIDINWVTGGVWSIGNDGTLAREFAGLLDDLALYDTLLGASDFLSIYNNGLAGQAIDGTMNLTPGDVNGVGGATIDDYNIILSNFLQNVGDGSTDTRPLGDLTNDGLVGLADFRAWKAAANPSTSASVPEPNSLFLVVAFGLIALVTYRRGATQAIAGCTAVLAVSLAGAPAAAQVVATIDQETGGVTISNLQAGTTEFEFDGYQFSSPNGLLNNAGWANFQNVQLIAGWEIVGTPNDARFAEALTTSGAATTIPSDSSPINFSTAFSPSNVISAQLAAGLGVEVRDVSFGFLEPGNSTLTQADVVYVGETVTNNLVVKVDVGTGNATLENESPFAVSIDGFTITSAGSSLNSSWAGSPDLTTGWDTVADATGVAQLNPNSFEAFDAAVGGVVQAGGAIDLGDIFTIGSDQDLQFSFLRNGVDDGNGFGGVVEYITPVLDGDYNSDGLVDAADYTVWRDNNGSAVTLPNDTTPGTVTQVDYDVWSGNYGASGVAPATSVPEPAAAGLALLGLAALAGRRTS